MKCLVLADIHGSLEKVQALKKSLDLKAIDLVICLGDFSNEGLLSLVEKAIKELSFTKLLVVPGNMDNEEVRNYLKKKKVLFHESKTKLEEWTFIGFGGAIPKHTWYKFNIGELQVKRVLHELLQGEKPESTILLTHSPAFNVLDKTKDSLHIGSRELLKAIEEFQPLLHLCAHVHEAKGQAKIKSTLSVNVGAIKEGHALLVELAAGKKPALKELKV